MAMELRVRMAIRRLVWRRARSSTNTSIAPTVSTVSGKKYGRLCALSSTVNGVMASVSGPIERTFDSGLGQVALRLGRAELPRAEMALRRPHAAKQCVQIGVDELEHHVGIEPEQDRQRAERVQREPLSPVQIWQVHVLGIQIAQEDALDRPEVVRGGDDHRDGGERRL